jgi:hypothetical protein
MEEFNMYWLMSMRDETVVDGIKVLLAQMD